MLLNLVIMYFGIACKPAYYASLYALQISIKSCV